MDTKKLFDRFEEDKTHKSEIGNFIVNFSRLEYTLAYLLAFSDTNLFRYEAYIPKMMALSFDKKLMLFSNYIKEDLGELQTDWKSIEKKIKQINVNRRYVAHGFIDGRLNNSNARIVRNGQFHPKELSHKELKKQSNEILEVLTGENGLDGEFRQKFFIARLDKWNELVNDNFKIVYTDNDDIKTKWKGSSDFIP